MPHCPNSTMGAPTPTTRIWVVCLVLLHGLKAGARSCDALSDGSQQLHTIADAHGPTRHAADARSSPAAAPTLQSWLRAALRCPCSAANRATQCLHAALAHLAAHADGLWSQAQRRLRSAHLPAALPRAVPGLRGSRLLLGEEEGEGEQPGKKHRVDIAALYNSDRWDQDEEVPEVMGGPGSEGRRGG
jgi:hypothetical protein